MRFPIVVIIGAVFVSFTIMMFAVVNPIYSVASHTMNLTVFNQTTDTTLEAHTDQIYTVFAQLYVKVMVVLILGFMGWVYGNSMRKETVVAPL